MHINAGVRNLNSYKTYVIREKKKTLNNQFYNFSVIHAPSDAGEKTRRSFLLTSPLSKRHQRDVTIISV